MKMKNILPILLVLPGMAFGATRGSESEARVGMMSRGSQAAARLSLGATDVKVMTQLVPSVSPSVANNVSKNESVSVPVEVDTPAVTTSIVAEETVTTASSVDCRDAYRSCMDEFCLLDESQGERCACSNNIDLAKGKLKTILAIQAEADKLFSEGVER